MPAYALLQNFMNMVHAANPTFERRVRSSLRPLITILASPTGTAAQVSMAVGALPVDKVNRYLTPLYYLLATYPGLPMNAPTQLHMGVLGDANAARYPQTPMPGNFNPVGPPNQRVFVTPASASLGVTLEQFILLNHATTSVLLIHLSSVQAGMERMFNGRSTIEHINSVLQVARLKNCPLCVLTMEGGSDVCPALRAQFNLFPVRTRVYEPVHHTGLHLPAYINFATARPNLVVMGFDAGVCVFANAFGSSQTMGPGLGYCPPLATLADVIMSRAALVSNGTINSNSATFGQAEYGPLFNT